MAQLAFRIEYRGEAPNQVAVKVRDSGAFGRCIGDEAALWDALQEALAENERLRVELEARPVAQFQPQHERKGKR